MVKAPAADPQPPHGATEVPPCSGLGGMRLRRFGAAAADLAAQAKTSKCVCGFVCSHRTLGHIFQHCWKGLVQQLCLTSSASQLPHVLQWYNKSFLQEGQPLLKTHVSTDTFEQAFQNRTACWGLTKILPSVPPIWSEGNRLQFITCLYIK